MVGADQLVVGLGEESAFCDTGNLTSQQYYLHNFLCYSPD